MSIVVTEYRGLRVEGDVDPYVSGVRPSLSHDGHPEEGGGCWEHSWDVADINEVLLHLGLSEGIQRMIHGYFILFGYLPNTIVWHIDTTWELEMQVEEHYALGK